MGESFAREKVELRISTCLLYVFSEEVFKFLVALFHLCGVCAVHIVRCVCVVSVFLYVGGVLHIVRCMFLLWPENLVWSAGGGHCVYGLLYRCCFVIALGWGLVF